MPSAANVSISIVAPAQTAVAHSKRGRQKIETKAPAFTGGFGTPKNSDALPDGKISDYIDGVFRNDTPEEYVRQTVEKRLINEHKYAFARVAVEFTIQIGSGKKRADIVVFDTDAPHTQENARIIIECKQESVEPSSAREGIAQLQSYMAACPNCEWGMWTNGKFKSVFRKVVDERGTIAFEDYNDIPSADGRLEDIDRPKRNTLKDAYDDNLLFVFKTCHNLIYANEGLSKQEAFFELLKLIFCKIEDERDIPKTLEFYATSGERGNQDGQLTVRNRISKIFERVKKKHGNIFTSSDGLLLKPRSLAHIVSELQKYSLLNTNIDIKGKAYEEIVGANLRGDKGQFFTPRNVMRMVVEMLNPTLDEKVLDSSCGTGGFLVNAMMHVMDALEKQFAKQVGSPRGEWDAPTTKVFQDRVAEMARTNYFGFDIEKSLVKATKMNMVMNNDGSGNILEANSLLPPHEWDAGFRDALAEALDPASPPPLRNARDLAHFDVIVTNPPFGSQIPIKDENILLQFELARIWEKPDPKKDRPHWVMTDRLQTSVPPEILFIERCLQFLKPGGRIGIVLPDSILGAPGLGYIRQWLFANTRIVASLDLHADTFQPRNGTQTSVLILQKRTDDELRKQERTDIIPAYKIFMAMIEKVGHDKRGNPIFKRDPQGNEILVDEPACDGKPSRRRKVPDDQTIEIPALFAEWKKEEGIPW